LLANEGRSCDEQPILATIARTSRKRAWFAAPRHPREMGSRRAVCLHHGLLVFLDHVQQLHHPLGMLLRGAGFPQAVEFRAAAWYSPLVSAARRSMLVTAMGLACTGAQRCAPAATSLTSHFVWRDVRFAINQLPPRRTYYQGACVAR
jgi:hypothetical protein